MVYLKFFSITKNRINKLAITLMLAAGTWITGQAQEVAVKTNLLYDATTTLNLGVEIGLGSKMTLDISGNYNPWRFHDYRLKHGLIQLDLRKVQRTFLRTSRFLRKIQCRRTAFQQQYETQPLSGASVWRWHFLWISMDPE